MDLHDLIYNYTWHSYELLQRNFIYVDLLSEVKGKGDLVFQSN